MSYLLGVLMMLAGQLGIVSFNTQLTGCKYSGRLADLDLIRPSLDTPPNGALLVMMDSSKGYLIYKCALIKEQK